MHCALDFSQLKPSCKYSAAITYNFETLTTLTFFLVKVFEQLQLVLTVYMNHENESLMIHVCTHIC